MCGPGEYRPDPSVGITAPADLPQPEIVPYSRNDIRQPCPRCGHSAYRDKQSHRTLHDLVRIPRMSATQSMGRLPLNPRESCHPIHTIPATQST